MTKTISLSDEAYRALSRAKRTGESFSDVALRLSKLASQEALFDPELRIEMSEEQAEAWVASILQAREAEREPRVEFP